MQISRQQLEPTKIKLTIEADQAALDQVKQSVLARLSKNVRVPGFRLGKAPAHLTEKQLDPTILQSEFLDEAVNQFYVHAADSENLRPVGQPQIRITKFVPFTAMEFTAEVEVVGEIKLSDYKKVKLAAKTVEVKPDEIKTVIDNLRQRAAEKHEVARAAKDGDEVTINFKGVDAKSKQPIDGADGTAYPLVIGSQRFIPGFEEQLVGLMPGNQKTFDITFPKDYNVADLQNRKVNFDVTVIKIEELKLPMADDNFAATVGNFKTISELKADIKKQLKAEKQQEADRAYDNELLKKISEKSDVAIPKALIDEEIDRLEEEEKRNLVYQGQTWEEHLKAEGVSAEDHRERQREPATARVKAGLILGEISQKENIKVSPEELEIRIQLLKGQYTDPATQAELDKPENRRDILSRMMTELTLDKLRSAASKSVKED